MTDFDRRFREAGLSEDEPQAHRRLAFLADASAVLASSLDYETTLRNVARLAVPEIADWCAIDLLTGREKTERVAIEHPDSRKVDLVRRLQERYSPDPTSGHGVAHVIRTGEPDMLEAIPDSLFEEVARSEEHLRILRSLGLRSYIIAPLVARDHVLGTVTLVYAESGRRYTADDLPFVQDLARRAAVAIDNARLVQDAEEARQRSEEQALELETQAAELQETTARLQAANEEKDALLESTGDGIYGLDEDGNCTFLNRAGAAMLGYTPAEALGRNMHDLVHHSRADGRPYPGDECPIYHAFRSKKGVRVRDEVLWRKDGTCFPAEYSSYPIVENGRAIGSVVAFNDITERKRIEERERLFGMVLEESLNEIYIFDAETLHFVQVNRGARDNLGYTMDELRELTPLDLKPEFTPEEFAELIEPLRRGRTGALHFETVHRRKDGTLYPVDVHLQLSDVAEDRVFVAVILDITARRRVEREREGLIEELAEANKAKSDFMATMSHELRTPLNAIVGYADLLELGVPMELPDPLKVHVQRIRLSANHLLQLIDEILTFSRIEAGRQAVDVARVDVPELIDEIRAIIGPLAEERGLDFSIDTDATPDTIESDPRKFRQILLNLLGNAVKFTHEGAVRLTTTFAEGRLTIRVEDTGIGISDEERGKLFEPFWQADQSRTRVAGGTGLGLTITRELVHMLGGGIDVESEVGKGSVFTVWLPIPTRADQSSAERTQ